MLALEFSASRYRAKRLFPIVAENRVSTGLISFAFSADLQKTVRTIPHFSVVAKDRLCRLLCPQRSVRSALCESSTLVSSRRRYLYSVDGNCSAKRKVQVSSPRRYCALCPISHAHNRYDMNCGIVASTIPYSPSKSRTNNAWSKKWASIVEATITSNVPTRTRCHDERNTPWVLSPRQYVYAYHAY